MVFVQLVILLLNKEQKDSKMLLPRLTDCVNCSSIPALLANIDCKLLQLSKDLYNNTVFILNKKFSSVVMNDLLMYKRILTYKYCNSEYAGKYTVDQIASRVRVLTGNSKACCSECYEGFGGYGPTTTSTTTVEPISYVEICLGYSDSGCSGACSADCSTYYVSQSCYNSIIGGDIVQRSDCTIYTDSFGSVPAPTGNYSYNGGLCFFVSNGEITGITNC